MSASSKKMLRKEQNAAAMTEKQLQEQKEAKKLRRYTAAFAFAIVAMILVVVFSRVSSSGIIPRSTTALTVGGTKVSAAELNHYYIDSVNNFLNSYGDYVSMFGLDTTKALDDQFYNEAEEQTWSDYFLETATASAQNMYAIYNEAKANGFTMSDESKASIDATVENMALYATMYGFSSPDAYIAAMYGEGCNEKTFRQYAEVQMTAQEYTAAKSEELTYDDAALRAEDEKNPAAYSAFTYNSYYLANSTFYQGGTEDEEGNKTYSDEEKEAGRAAAAAAANALLNTAGLKAIFCSNEGAVTGFLAAVSDGEDLAEGGKYDGLVVAGFDAGAAQKNAVRQGWFYGSVTQDPYQIGYQAVALAVAAANGEAVSDVDTGAQWYNAENIDDEMIALLVYD